MSDIFISFNSEDVEFAKKLSDTIENETEFSTWLYTERIHSGDTWSKEIDDAIEGCYALIVIMTPEAIKSQYVTYEWAYADGLGIKVMPILYKDTNRDIKTKWLNLAEAHTCP